MIADAFEPAGVLLAGLPNTGKTSYLALLYIAIVEGRATQLALGTYRDDREYLNRISGQLQRCRPAIHTEVAEQQALSLSVLVGDERRPTLLRIPDTSGETWEAAVVERHLPTDLDERASAADAVILFVHPKQDFDAGVTIVQANAADTAALGAPPPLIAGAREPHRRSPTQVELVDLLQILREERGPRPGRACVVVSAYDLVQPQVAPDEWISRNLPLLAQYVDVNRGWLDVAVFGVSAQGGRFDQAESLATLSGRDALDRAFVLAGDGNAAHPEDPVLWALGCRG